MEADVPRVAASEQDLVLLARALIQPSPAEARVLLHGSREMPPAISTACAQLLGDALAKVWPALWRRGSARLRLWERYRPAELAFSPATLQLLRWLVGAPLHAPGAAIAASGPLTAETLSIGDQVMVYLALDAAAGTPAQAVIAAQPLVRAAPLAWLGFAELFGAAPSPSPSSFGGLCHGAGAIVVESLAPELARRWRASELGKRAIESPDALIALGAAQDATLGGFMAACENHRRRDLAGFVIDAAAPLIARELAPVPERLDPAHTLSRRAEARVAAGALLRAVLAWEAWDQAHRGVRFIDDDYAAAQPLLARFEAIGASGAARARAWLSALGSLGSLAPTTPPGSAATVVPP